MKVINCLICGTPLSVRVSHGRKSNKPFIMFICPKDGRHFRGFITDQKYVAEVMNSKQISGTGNGSGTE